MLSVFFFSVYALQGATGHKDTLPSPADEFLVGGGDSLRAVQLVDQVEQFLGHQVPDLLDTILTRTFGEFLFLLQQHATETGAMVKESGTVNRVGSSEFQETTGAVPEIVERLQLREYEDNGALSKRVEPLPHSLQNEGTVTEPGTAKRTSSGEVETSGRMPETVKRVQLREYEDNGTLSKRVEPLSHSSQNEGTMMEAKTKKRKHPCRTACHGGQLEPLETGRKVRKLSHTENSDVGTEIHSNGEMKNHAEILTCACGCNRGDSCQQTTVLAEPEAVTAATESVRHETTAPLAASPSWQQGQNVAAEEHARHDDVTSEMNVSKEYKHIAGDDFFLRSVGRANSHLLTTHHARLDSDMCSDRQRQCHEDLAFCEDDKSAPSKNLTVFCSASKVEDREGGRVKMTPKWIVNTGKCVDASPLVAVTRLAFL